MNLRAVYRCDAEIHEVLGVSFVMVDQPWRQLSENVPNDGYLVRIEAAVAVLNEGVLEVVGNIHPDQVVLGSEVAGCAQAMFPIGIDGWIPWFETQIVELIDRLHDLRVHAVLLQQRASPARSLPSQEFEPLLEETPLKRILEI